MTKADDERFGAELSSMTPQLRMRALSLTQSAPDASDLVQDTLLKAWKARGQFQPGTNLKAWLMCIMRNSFMSDRRRRKWETAEGLSDYAEGLLAPPSQEWAVAAHTVRHAIAGLTPEHAGAILLVGALGESYEEASRRSGCPQGTLKSRVSRARRELRERTHVDQLFVRERQAAD